MREQGILIVGEVDDNYLSNPRLNVFMRANEWSRQAAKDHARALLLMDRVVFSTEVLRDIYWDQFKYLFKTKGKRLPEPFVCRNNLDVADWPEIPPYDGPVRVGWMGSPSHVWDIDLAWNALLHAKRQGARVILIGLNPMLPEGQPIPASMRSARSQAKIDQWGRVGYEHIPWVAPEKYGRPALPLDIGLCPLVANAHTDGKSDVKAVEYAISGAAVIAQDTPVYNRTLIHGETALLVKDEREMLYATDILIGDPALRLRLANNLRRYVYEERGLKQLRSEWGAALSTS